MSLTRKGLKIIYLQVNRQNIMNYFACCINGKLIWKQLFDRHKLVNVSDVLCSWTVLNNVSLCLYGTTLTQPFIHRQAATTPPVPPTCLTCQRVTTHSKPSKWQSMIFIYFMFNLVDVMYNEIWVYILIRQLPRRVTLRNTSNYILHGLIYI